MTTGGLKSESVGAAMHAWATDLFPICRSLTGSGVRQTLAYLRDLLPGLEIHAVPSGTPAFDWTVPDEWNIDEAYIAHENGERMIDFHNHNLHVVGYSEPVDQWMSLDELNGHLYSLPEQPDAIPYVTSYYTRRWGFCLSENRRRALPPGRYHAVIRSTLASGVLNYGEWVLRGSSAREIFLSTYICHPSMANNELSGPVVAAALAQWLQSRGDRRYTYRLVFIPETIGSLVYLSRNLDRLKQHVVAGFNLTCVGDDRCYSFLPSRSGDTRADRAARHVLKHMDPDYRRYTWLDRGSDERQYCAPGIDLPVATIMRSKYGTYPEYHTSLDDLNLVTPSGLEGAFKALCAALEVIEEDGIPRVTVLGEPQLGRRGLYPTISQKGSATNVRDLMNLISYCDGQRTLLEIADLIHLRFTDALSSCRELIKQGLVTWSNMELMEAS